MVSMYIIKDKYNDRIYRTDIFIIFNYCLIRAEMNLLYLKKINT